MLIGVGQSNELFQHPSGGSNQHAPLCLWADFYFPAFEPELVEGVIGLDGDVKGSRAMLRLFIDQDLDHDILRGLMRRIPRLDAVTAFEAGMSEVDDRELLIRAAQEGRVVVTHDRQPCQATRET